MVNISDFDFRIRGRRLKIGVVSEEFFETEVAGVGGFGFALKQLSSYVNQYPDLGIEMVLLRVNKVPSNKNIPEKLYGSRVLWRKGGLMEYFRLLRRENFDLFLFIDNLKIYRLMYWSFPLTPCLFWIRDPRTPDDLANIQTVRIPGQEDHQPSCLYLPVLTYFRHDYVLSKIIGRRMLFAAASRLVIQKFPKTYGFDPEHISFLTNIIDRRTAAIRKSDKPSVIVLGRIDPVKRPWLVPAIAERFPEVDFYFLGGQFIHGERIWKPDRLPLNLRMMGHVDGPKKMDLLASSWVLLNTSIHEGLAVSFLEALLYETPILSCVNPDGITDRYGVFTGVGNGTGLQLLPRFEEGLRKLLSDTAFRERLGKEGREFVESECNFEKFLPVFHQLCVKATRKV